MPPAPGTAAARASLVGPVRPTRAPQRRSLTEQAHTWLARLPPRYQPLATARRHPHIVNRMAEMWTRPAELPAYFRDLLLSGREGRKGFSFDVLTELFDLQAMVQQGVSH